MAATSLSNCFFSVQAVIGSVSVLPTGFQNPIANSLSVSNANSFTVGSGDDQINVPISFIISPLIPPSGTQTLILTGTLTDLLNEELVDITLIKGLLIELLSEAQHTDGTQCNSITCGAAGVHAWTSILNSTGTYTINNGDWWAHGSAAGVAVAAASSDQLLITNNDATYSACVRVTFFASNP